jgi:hypothetical protein
MWKKKQKQCVCFRCKKPVESDDNFLEAVPLHCSPLYGSQPLSREPLDGIACGDEHGFFLFAREQKTPIQTNDLIYCDWKQIAWRKKHTLDKKVYVDRADRIREERDARIVSLKDKLAVLCRDCKWDCCTRWPLPDKTFINNQKIDPGVPYFYYCIKCLRPQCEHCRESTKGGVCNPCVVKDYWRFRQNVVKELLPLPSPVSSIVIAYETYDTTP